MIRMYHDLYDFCIAGAQILIPIYIMYDIDNESSLFVYISEFKFNQVTKQKSQ